MSKNANLIKIITLNNLISKNLKVLLIEIHAHNRHLTKQIIVLPQKV